MRKDAYALVDLLEIFVVDVRRGGHKDAVSGANAAIFCRRRRAKRRLGAMRVLMARRGGGCRRQSDVCQMLNTKIKNPSHVPESRSDC